MNNKSSLYPQEPTWFCNRLRSRLQIPANAASWIYEADSITQRLRNYYGSSVRVQVLNNHWQRAFISENKLLQHAPNKYTLTREVLLYADDIPLVLARTIIPPKTVRSAQQNLSHLGNRPLGEVIFSYPKLERLALEIAKIPTNTWNPTVRHQAQIKQELWGRRTIYAINHHPLLVSEFFLPEILNH
ncbi:MAG: chorismate--pyruvate lyase [Methyloprofundus sp.]|nr:MAG: chorismate--pyruvate lyase [Methyloprofundus sp.]